MFIDSNNTSKLSIAKDVEIRDTDDNVVQNVIWFDTETRLAKIRAQIVIIDPIDIITMTQPAKLGTRIIPKKKGDTPKKELVSFMCSLPREDYGVYNIKTGERLD